jgi:hypothetical protein
MQSYGQQAVFNAPTFKIFGAVLALLAAATMALGIANVVLTKQSYCEPWMEGAPVYCSGTKEPYIWTWVAPGIWASVPIFLAGIFSMCISNDPANWTRCFALFIFLSAIVFSPAMIVLSAMEVWRGAAAQWNFYKLGNQLDMGNIMVANSPYQAKFALPLVIAILGGVMFIMTGIITLILCCCMESIGIYLPQDVPAPVPVAQPVYQPAPQPVVVQKEVYYPRPQIARAPMAIDYPPAVFNNGPNIATRYTSSYDPYGGVLAGGQFPVRSFAPARGFGSDFFQPQPASFWS